MSLDNGEKNGASSQWNGRRVLIGATPGGPPVSTPDRGTITVGAQTYGMIVDADGKFLEWFKGPFPPDAPVKVTLNLLNGAQDMVTRRIKDLRRRKVEDGNVGELPGWQWAFEVIDAQAQ